MDKYINDINLKLVKENIIRKINKAGIPMYKSLYSIYFPSVLFKLLIVIYKFKTSHNNFF